MGMRVSMNDFEARHKLPPMQRSRDQCPIISSFTPISCLMRGFVECTWISGAGIGLRINNPRLWEWDEGWWILLHTVQIFSVLLSFNIYCVELFGVCIILHTRQDRASHGIQNTNIVNKMRTRWSIANNKRATGVQRRYRQGKERGRGWQWRCSGHSILLLVLASSLHSEADLKDFADLQNHLFTNFLWSDQTICVVAWKLSVRWNNIQSDKKWSDGTRMGVGAMVCVAGEMVESPAHLD